MNKSFESTRNPHRLILLEKANDLIAETRLTLLEKVKFFSRFIKLVSREDLQKNAGLLPKSTSNSSNTSISQPPILSPNQPLTFPLMKLKLTDCETPSFTSTILLFESCGSAVFVDVSHINFPTLSASSMYLLFGQFDLVESETPVFFAHTVAPCGQVDFEIRDKTLSILKHKGVIEF